jgi:hypothetical protein
MADGDYRILVTGSRDWQDITRVSFELGRAIGEARRDGHDWERIVVVHGACPTGADAMAEQICRDYGWRTEPHAADWSAPCRPACHPGHRRRQDDGTTTCPAAGPYRNAEMVRLGANVCLAFIRNGSRGASGTAYLADEAGIPVRRFHA